MRMELEDKKHCGAFVNEKDDALGKTGSNMPQDRTRCPTKSAPPIRGRARPTTIELKRVTFTNGIV